MNWAKERKAALQEVEQYEMAWFVQEHDNPVFPQPKGHAEWQDLRQNMTGVSSASLECPGCILWSEG